VPVYFFRPAEDTVLRPPSTSIIRSLSIDSRALPVVSQWDDKLDTFVKAFLVKLADFLPSLVGALIGDFFVPQWQVPPDSGEK